MNGGWKKVNIYAGTEKTDNREVSRIRDIKTNM